MKRILYLFALIPIILFFASCEEKPEFPSYKKDNLHSFYFSPEHNPDLEEELVFTLDSKNKTFTLSTQDWIMDIESLIPSFHASGNVYFNSEEQISGESPNNFSKRVLIYTVHSEDEGLINEYKIVLESPQTTGLPLVLIEVEDGEEITSKENYLDAAIKIIDKENSDFNIDTHTQIRGRGNSTWGYPKKPYRLKFYEKTSIFGLKEAKSWVLLANYNDPTFLTGTVAFEIARRMNMEYTNNSNHVELFVNGKYQGKYELTEQVQIDKNRINVDEKNGGFLIEMDAYMDEKFCFYSEIYNLPVMLKDPETEETIEEIKELFIALENAISKEGFTYEDYSSMIDVNSLINYLIINEITSNKEILYPKSVYAYRKNRNDKLTFGPIWDYDWAFGYTGSNYEYFTNAEISIFSETYLEDYYGGYFYNRFFEDPVFVEKYKERWKEVHPLIQDIDNFTLTEGERQRYSQEENCKIWDTHKTKSYEELIKEMANWLKKRISFLDKEINK